MSGRPPVVALCGYSRVGKDTAAQRLLASGYRLGSVGERVAALVRARDLSVTLPAHPNGVAVDALFAELGYEGAKSIPEVRVLMQDVGSAAKQFQPDFFLRWVLECHTRSADPAAGLVIVGVRSAPEVAAVREVGGVVLRIHRPGVGPLGGHRTDCDVDEVVADADVCNDATPGVLHDRVDEALSQFRRVDEERWPANPPTQPSPLSRPS